MRRESMGSGETPRNTFFARAAMAWLENGKARAGGGQLSDQLGPCCNREEAVWVKPAAKR